MRLLRACLAAAIALAPQAALACGAMVSETGQSELTSVQALLNWDGANEELLLRVGYSTSDAEFAWLMPLPSAPEIEEADFGLYREARRIAAPPVNREGAGDEGAGAPPAVGGAPGGVDVIGRDTIGGLRFVTLGAQGATEVSRWMRKHGFAFHDQQEPVLQQYLDQGWVVVAARVAPGAENVRSVLQPVGFTFPSSEAIYPLAMAGAGHENYELGMEMFVLTPYRPTSTTYPEYVAKVDPEKKVFSPADSGLQLRYSAPLEEEATQMGATPETWLTWYTAGFPVKTLTQDLVLGQAEQQTPLDYSYLDEQDDILAWVVRIGVVLLAMALAIWISRGMARRRRAAEAPKMPNQPPPSA